jgi:hypothetical protein
MGLAIPNWAGVWDRGEGVAHLNVLDKNDICVHPSRWLVRNMRWEMVEKKIFFECRNWIPKCALNGVVKLSKERYLKVYYSSATTPTIS